MPASRPAPTRDRPGRGLAPSWKPAPTRTRRIGCRSSTLSSAALRLCETLLAIPDRGAGHGRRGAGDSSRNPSKESALPISTILAPDLPSPPRRGARRDRPASRTTRPPREDHGRRAAYPARCPVPGSLRRPGARVHSPAHPAAGRGGPHAGAGLPRAAGRDLRRLAAGRATVRPGCRRLNPLLTQKTQSIPETNQTNQDFTSTTKQATPKPTKGSPGLAHPVPQPPSPAGGGGWGRGKGGGARGGDRRSPLGRR